MDYQMMWEALKFWVDEALEEGRERGFDKEQDTFENGAFYGYSEAFEKMNRLDGGQNDRN